MYFLFCTWESFSSGRIFNLVSARTIPLIWILINCFFENICSPHKIFQGRTKNSVSNFSRGEKLFISFCKELTRRTISLEEFAQLKVMEANGNTCHASSLSVKEIEWIYICRRHQCILTWILPTRKLIHTSDTHRPIIFVDCVQRTSKNWETRPVHVTGGV